MPFRKQPVKSVLGQKSSDVLKSSLGSSISSAVCLGECEAFLVSFEDVLSCIKLHTVGVFFSLSGTRPVDGVGHFASMFPLEFEARANRKLVRRGHSLFLFTVLNAKGDAASNKSCVLIEGPCSALSSARTLGESSLWASNTERGVIAGLGWGESGGGVFCAGCDHGLRVDDRVEDWVDSPWNTSCASSIAACVEYCDCLDL